MRKILILVFILPLLVNFILAQTKSMGKQVRIFPDEYSELDDISVTKYVDDPVIMKALERARVKYLRALNLIEKKDTLLAEENFEQAIDILNSISYYPNIHFYKDYTDLVQSILEDYEKFVGDIQNLDESSSLFILRETLTKELERSSRSKGASVGKITEIKKDTLKSGEQGLGFAFQIPMDDNEYVKKSIEFLTQKPIGRKFVRNSLARSTAWGKIIKKIIEEEGMPQELFYLAMVESGFNPFAVSRAKAVGIWQFIMSTGQLYGLNSNSSPWVDERRDPIKSTRAAMRHLRDLYNELGDWHLAIAAYNCGINAVQRAIFQLGNTDSVNFWNIMQFLPRETRNYVPLFIATVKVVSNLVEFGFNPNEINYSPEITFDKYILEESVSLSAIAKCVSTTIDRIRELNPELVFSITPPTTSGYEIRIPYGTKQTFIANYLNLTPEEKMPVITYRTGKKETVESIAKKFGVEPREILLVNNITSSTKRLPNGTTLKIPIENWKVTTEQSGDSAEKEQVVRNNLEAESNNDTIEKNSLPKNKNIATRSVVRYIVKENENLDKISQKYKVPNDSLIAWNNLKNKNLYPGQTLKIYFSDETSRTENTLSKSSVATLDDPFVDNKRTSQVGNEILSGNKNNENLANKKIYHTVRRGETLESIAARYNTSIDGIISNNPELQKRKNKIFVGEKLVIKTNDKNEYNVNEKTKSKNKNVFNSQKKDGNKRYHIVKRGETLNAIADKYDVSISYIVSLNPKIKPNKLKVGQKIRIK